MFKFFTGSLGKLALALIVLLALALSGVCIKLSIERKGHIQTQQSLVNAQESLQSLERQLRRLELEQEINDQIQRDLNTELAVRKETLDSILRDTEQRIEYIKLQAALAGQSTQTECTVDSEGGGYDQTYDRLAADAIATGMWDAYENVIRNSDGGS